MPHPLAPTKPKKVPVSPGEVFDRRSADNSHRESTWLFAGVEHNDEIDGTAHPEPMFLFIVFQGEMGMVFRTRVTEAQIKDYGLIERRSGLNRYQQRFVAEKAFKSWQELEYRQMGLIK